MIEQEILQQEILEVVYPDMAELSRHDKQAFTLLRRNGLGASDASVYMGVNLYTSLSKLIEQKRAIGITDEEIAIGKKDNVRKGADLEPLILEKFSERMGIEVIKPAPMYKIIADPQLTINFDGVIDVGGQLIPVEAKWASPYANKYYDRTKSINTLFEGSPHISGGASMKEHIEDEARLCGIPPYYYTQVQQQMMGLDAPFSYLTVLFDKGWDDVSFKIFKDKYVQDGIRKESKIVWERVKRIYV